MNKKSFTTISIITLSVFASFSAIGQCTPDKNLKSPGFYPPQIDTAQANQAYSSIIQAKVPKDTQAYFLGNKVNVTVDSIVVKGVIGMPSGFSYVCSNPRCKFLADSVGCTEFKGSPTNSQVGVYPLQFITRSYGKANGIIPFSQIDTIKRFVLVVEGLSSMKVLKTNGFLIYPVPAKNELNVLVPSELGVVKSMGIYNLQGQYINSPEFDLSSEKLTKVDLKNLQSGMYFLKTETSAGVTFCRFTKE